MEPTTTRPFAVVTGASSGMGFEIANVLGGHGYDLLIAAGDDEIEGARRDLSSMTGVEAMQTDLALSENVEELHRRILSRGRPLDVLIVNAEVGAGGPFAGTDLRAEMRLIDLNVRMAVQLCKLELGAMVARDEGRILFSSSVATTEPGASQAIFHACRAFVRQFATALHNELEDTNVIVTSLLPDQAARQGVDAMLGEQE